MIIVQIAGRLGKDAESRFTPSGQKVTTLTMATNIRKGGKEETVWWRVTIWGDRYDKMMPYFKKGSALIVIGDMNKPDIWTDKEGRQQVSMELTADIIRFNPFGSSTNERNPQETPVGNQASTPNYGVSSQSNAAYQPNTSYSNDSGDFGGMMQGNGSRYMPSDSAEEQLPF